jgi:hypothetical protein
MTTRSSRCRINRDIAPTWGRTRGEKTVKIFVVIKMIEQKVLAILDAEKLHRVLSIYDMHALSSRATWARDHDQKSRHRS